MPASNGSTQTRESVSAIERAQSSLQRLRWSYEGSASIFVYDSQLPAAYSWSNGKIGLSSGLIRLLDDDELSAVIAHELGHLAHAQNEPLQRFALGGARTDDERRADSVGIILLLTSGIPPESLAHALEKVRDAPQTPADLQQAMANRIALLPQ